MELLPVIDIAPMIEGGDAAAQGSVARAIELACRDSGFFYVRNHGVSAAVIARLDAESRRFFALPRAAKAGIAMKHGGPAWRGWFPLEGELTSGRPDQKEGLYFGTELPPDHPRVVGGWPLHGANQWPVELPALRPAVEDYMAATQRAARSVLEGVALALGLDPQYFARTYTAEPTILFRIFLYPANRVSADTPWGVGEHTDYGLLTLLAQDECGGLQVKTPRGWIDAPPLQGTLVCNIGDMLDRLTGGWFRSTPHRVRNSSGRDRLSFPLFFDPDFAAEIRSLPAEAQVGHGESGDRWDGADLQRISGRYGDYLLGKVGKVFPELRRGLQL